MVTADHRTRNRRRPSAATDKQELQVLKSPVTLLPSTTTLFVPSFRFHLLPRLFPSVCTDGRAEASVDRLEAPTTSPMLFFDWGCAAPTPGFNGSGNGILPSVRVRNRTFQSLRLLTGCQTQEMSLWHLRTLGKFRTFVGHLSFVLMAGTHKVIPYSPIVYITPMSSTLY